MKNERYLYAKKAVTLLKEKELTVSFAESCTGGMVAETITTIPGASEVFELGVVTYGSNIKVKLLGIPNELISEKGVVSREVAEAMANGIRRLASSTYGIGITGVAGPGPSDGHPEGEIFISLSGPEGTVTKRLFTETINKREYNRQKAVEIAFLLLLENIK